MDYSKKTSQVVAGAAVLCAAAGLARGQESTPPEAGDLAEVMELYGPQDLPGRERGARTREEDVKPEEAPPPEDREWFGGKPWWEWERATGDWGGVRTTLEANGLKFAGSYTLDWSSVWSGGLKNVASTRSLLDFNATFDFEPLLGIKGGSIYVDFYSTDMRGGSRDVGDFQGTSNIETGDNVDEIAELWYEQKLFENVLRVKVGKIDANSEFAFVDSSSDFLHMSAGFLETIADFPTYPDPAMGVVVFGYPTDWLYVGAGIFDGALAQGVPTGRRGPETFFSDDDSDAWFSIGEVGVTWDGLLGGGAGKLCAGVWHQSAVFEKFDGGTEGGTTGSYLMGEHQIWRRGEKEEEKERGLFAWVQYGWADEDVWDIGNNVALGVTLRGTFGGRDDDSAGVFVSFADLSDADGSPYQGNETALEFTYRVQVTPAFVVRPDLQFVFDPSGNPEIDTAVVGGVRFEVSF